MVGPVIGLRESGFVYLLLLFNGREGGAESRLAPEQSSLGQEGLASDHLTPVRPDVSVEPGGLVFCLRSQEDECGVWENKEGMRWCLGEWEGTRGGLLATTLESPAELRS